MIAARELDLAGVNNFAVVEARAELGGRMMSTKLNGVTLELGANWIEGLESEETGKVNPIWELAQKAKLDVVDNDWEVRYACMRERERNSLIQIRVRRTSPSTITTVLVPTRRATPFARPTTSRTSNMWRCWRVLVRYRRG